MNKLFRLRYDTSATREESTYTIRYQPDSMQLLALKRAQESASGPGYWGTVQGLAESLYEKYGVLVNSADTQFVGVAYDWPENFDSYRKEVQQRYGLVFRLSVRKIPTIRVSFND